MWCWISKKAVWSTCRPLKRFNRLTARYAKAGKKVHLRHLSEDCRALIDKAESIIEVNHFEDPTYKVVRDLR